jgi:tRNA pseudouridine38-40 synthase
MEPTKLKLTIAYDGTNYAGWQVQKIGLGVQQKIEEAFQKIFGEPFRLHSSSRTDTGVHARAMIAHVELPPGRFNMTPSKLALGLNALLPPDIRIMEAARAPKDFHARFDAKGKQYRYFVYNHAAHDPLLRHISWHVPRELDMEAMRSGTKHFLGKRDFAAFAANRNYEMESTVRTIKRCELKRAGPLLTFIIQGDGFLYKMCRGIVGTLVQVGVGKFEHTAIPQILESKDRRIAGMTAPAHGLVLWKVFY